MAQGDTQTQDLFNQFPSQAKGTKPQAKQGMVPPDKVHRQQGTDNLGDDRRPCGASDSHFQSRHKHQVQDDIDDHADSDAEEGQLGIAYRPERRAGPVIAGDKEHPQGADAQILLRLLQGRRSHPYHNLIGQQIEDQGHRRADDQTHGKQSHCGRPALLLPSASEKLSDQNTAADGQADDDLGQKRCHRSTVSDGRLGVAGAAVLSGNHHICDIVGSLEHVGHNKGHRIAHQGA